MLETNAERGLVTPRNFGNELPTQDTSALSQLRSRIGNFGRIGDAAWHKEVCHAEVVCRSPDEARTSRASGRCQEAKGDRAESSPCSDSAEGRRRWSQLDRRANCRGLLVSDET